MEPQYCAEESCPKHRIHTGGKFSVRLSDGKTFCEDCFQWAGTGASCKNLWEFTTTHFDGTPVRVRGLHHLRQLEKQYGVSSHAANYDQRNWERHHA
jgi:hypothetical protein